jgi:uncharacterized protein YcbK (DUF882 family)
MSYSTNPRSVFRICGLWLTVVLLLSPLAPSAGWSAVHSTPEYRLRFYHTHTHERLNVVYRNGNSYIPEALDELDLYLRDHQYGGMCGTSIPACSIFFMT